MKNKQKHQDIFSPKFSMIVYPENSTDVLVGSYSFGDKIHGMIRSYHNLYLNNRITANEFSSLVLEMKKDLDISDKKN
jgi:hypothetical protein